MICTKCQTDKPATEDFFQIRSDTKKFRKQCKTCRKQHVDNYQNSNRELTRARNRASYRKYSEKTIARTTEYKRTNREWCRTYNREWSRKRRAESVEVRITSSLRGRVTQALRHAKKSAATMSLVGCSLDELKTHLENQFTEGMSWANYGNPNKDQTNCWHIDHIKPCSLFDLTDPEQQKMCFHYSNLQPLWAKDNLRKYNKYTSDDTN